MSGNMSLLGGKSVPAYSSCGYYSDSAVMERAPRRDEYQDGLHIHKTGDFSSDEEVSDDELRDKVAIDLPLETTPFLQTQNRYVNHTSSRRSQSSRAVTKVAQKRNINKLRRDSSNVKKLRVSAYCTCDHISIFKLFKWLEKKDESSAAFTVNENEKLNHYMYTGVVHVAITSATDDASNEAFYREKHAFYFSSGIAVFWGFTRTEEKKHLQALRTFSVGFVKQIEVEDMDFCYGEVRKIVNDAITLSTGDPLEKLAYSFAMAQSAKLDNFEERVEDTIKETRHIPQNLATTGSINYSQNDISKLIGRLFIERNDVNLNSNMLDTPEFFWEFDEWEPLYKKMLRYLDVDNRVQILNSRLDILRELLDVLSQQLAHQHDTKLEWIIIWLIVSEVVVQLVWNMLIKDILGYFPGHPSS